MRVYLSDYAFNSNRTIFSFNLKILYEFYNFLKYKSSILIENRRLSIFFFLFEGADCLVLIFK